MPSVFITDFDHRKALAAARNLAKHGVTVIGGSDDPSAIGRFSKYCSRFVRYPSPRTRPDDYYAFLRGFLEEHAVDVLMPMDDETVLIAAAHRDELSRLTAVPVPPLDIVRRARDKAQTISWARRAGVRAPETWMPASPMEADALARSLPFPVLIKPRESSGSRGIVRVDGPSELGAKYRQVHVKYPHPMIQEFIPYTEGKYHVQLLMDAGSRVVAQFTHQVIREWPIRGGVGTFWISTSHPDSEAQTIRLLEAMGWGPGVVMSEFVVDARTGQAVLMEINPRFWGTLQSSISAGVEFPYLLFELAMGRPVGPVTQYQHGVACQWLLPGDILHFLFNPHRWHADPPYFPRRGDSRAFAILSRDDPMPAFGLFLTVAYHLFDIGKWKHVFRKL